MDRCALAYQYHKEGFNCAQSVVRAFADKIEAPLDMATAMAAGLGGGLGGTHTELCGAVSGAVMTLGLLYPHTSGADQDGKKRVYELAKEFRRRFEEIFGNTRCGELLASRPGLNEKTTAASRLEINGHCNIMIVTAVEILEQMLSEQEND